MMVQQKLRATRHDAAVVDRYLGLFGLEQGGTLKDQSLRLQDFLDRYVRPDDRVSCQGENACGGYYHEFLRVCPFCGEDDGQVTEEEEQGAIKSLLSAKEAEKSANDKLVKPVVESEAEPESDDDLAETSLQDVQERLSAAGMSIPGKPTEKDLDEAVQQIAELHRNSMVNAYDLGAWLLKVKSLRLWEQRKKEGESVYTSWAGFVEKETRFSRRYADKLAAVAWLYTRDAVQKVGVETLYVLIGVEPEHRQQLVDQAVRGELTTGQARERVVELSGGQTPTREIPGAGKFGHGKGKRSTGAGKKKPRASKASASPAPATPAATAETAPAAKNQITVALATGKRTVKFQRGAEDKPCKRLADDPQAVEMLANGATIRYRITTSKKASNLGQILLEIEVTRPEDA